MWLLTSVSCTKILEHQAGGRQPSEQTGESFAPAGFKTFTILAGQHYARENAVQKLDGTALAFEVLFDSTCIYQTRKAENQADINKLLGFSDNSSHHSNSARFGWRWNRDRIELLAYCYADGKRSFQLLGNLAIGERADLYVGLRPEFYEFQMNGETTLMKRTVTGTTINGYMLYPYFGGDETAPHTMRVAVRVK